MRTPPPSAAVRRLRPLALSLAVVLGACSPSSVLSPTPKVDIGETTAAITRAEPASAIMPAPAPSTPYVTGAGYPRFEPPMSPPLMSQPYSEPQAMPAEEIDCRRQLRQLGVTYRDLPTIDQGRGCQIDWPVQVTGLPAGIALKPAATLTCQMALSFAAWTKDELVPTVRWKYFTGVKTINQGSSYYCRNIAGTSTLSEHGKGNALDVMSIDLKSGRDIDVRRPGFFRFREKALLNNVRKGGCSYFTTVLGPGYNPDHANHFHFDIKNRRNGYVACR